MPLIDCPACGRQISTEAESCPQCGHPRARQEQQDSAAPAREFTWASGTAPPAVQRSEGQDYHDSTAATSKVPDPELARLEGKVRGQRVALGCSLGVLLTVLLGAALLAVLVVVLLGFLLQSVKPLPP
jgi:hypothetical protein